MSRASPKTACKTCVRWRLLLLATVALLVGLKLAWGQDKPADATGHELVLDGQTFELKLDTETTLKLKDGREITAKLVRRAFTAFEKDGTSFEHPSSLSIASSDKNAGVNQHIGVTALGTLVLLQVHEKVDLPLLRDTVFDSMLKEARAKNLNVNTDAFERQLADGKAIKGIKARYAEGTEDDVTIEIGVLATDAGNYLAMTMFDKASAPQEAAIVERFWKTLKLK